MAAASATRSSTSVKGGSSRSTTPLKKNDPPHSTESAASNAQSRASIRPSLAVISRGPGEIVATASADDHRRPPDFRKLFRPQDDLDHLVFVTALAFALHQEQLKAGALRPSLASLRRG